MRASAPSYKLITDENPRSYISEAYRILRTNIQFSSIDQQVQTILVTSSEPSDGKTTTIANLAVAFAQEGKSVVLIDADLRKPALHYYLQRSNKIGLSHLLAGQYELKQTLQETHVPNLSIITAGQVPPNPSEMLASKQFDQLLAQLKQQFDIVLVDTPPTVSFTDSQILSAKCDGVVFVLNAGKVKRETAQKAIDRLQKVGARVLGVVLNNKERPKGEEQQYYEYLGK